MDLIKKIANRHIILGLLIIAYLFLEISQINLPGLFCDEAIVGTHSLMILNNEDCGNPSAIKVFNRTFPLAIGLHGALSAYLILPFLYFLGINTSSLRLFTILGGAFTLFFIYLFVKEVFNYKVALICILLLTINFTFFLITKMALMCGSVSHTVFFSLLLCFLKWYLHKKSTYFLIGMFLLGLGLSLGYPFYWVIVSLSICALIFHSDLLKRIKENSSFPIEALFGFLFFALGTSLILYYNFRTKFDIVRTILKYAHYSSAGINNLNYIGNLFYMLRQLLYFLDGQGYTGRNHYSSIFFLLSLGWIVYLLIFKKISLFPKKRILFILILFLSILLPTPFTTSTLKGTTLFFFSPLLQIILGLAFIEAFFYFKQIRIGAILIYITLSIFIFIETNKFFRGYTYFKKTHGEGFVSDAINDLAKWLSKKKDYNIIVLDWGVYHNLHFLTGGKLNIIHICENDQEKRESPEVIQKLFNEKNNLYVSLRPEFRSVSSCSDIFAEAVQKNNFVVIEEKSFCQRNNQIIYSVFSIDRNNR